jgi:hypothetical protein
MLKKPSSLVSVKSVQSIRLTSKVDNKTSECYVIEMEKLHPLKSKEGKIINPICKYAWSFFHAARRLNNPDKAMKRILRHVALVEFRSYRAPRIVRDTFKAVLDLYKQGEWHRDLWRNNIMRTQEGTLKLVDVGAVVPAKTFDLTGRVDPAEGIFHSAVGPHAKVAEAMESLKKHGWDPKTAKKKLKAIKREVLRELRSTE